MQFQRNTARISLRAATSEKQAAKHHEKLRKNSLGNYKSDFKCPTIDPRRHCCCGTMLPAARKQSQKDEWAPPVLLPDCPAGRLQGYGTIGLSGYMPTLYKWLEITPQTTSEFVAILGLTVPNGHYIPARIREASDIPAVALNVALSFPTPKRGAGRRHNPSVSTVMTMPEAPMNKDDRTILSQHDVGISWQRSLVDAEPVTEPMQRRPDAEFRLGILTTDRRHVTPSLLPRMDISHSCA
jgi:hypothetical protein